MVAVVENDISTPKSKDYRIKNWLKPKFETLGGFSLKKLKSLEPNSLIAFTSFNPLNDIKTQTNIIIIIIII